MTTTDPAALQAEIARLTAENDELRQARSKQWQIGNLAAETANGNEPLATKQDADELRGIAYYALRELWKLNGIYIGETKKVEELEKDKSELKELVLSLAKQSDQFRQRGDTYRRRARALLNRLNDTRIVNLEVWNETVPPMESELATLRAALAASQARERRLREREEILIEAHAKLRASYLATRAYYAHLDDCDDCDEEQENNGPVCGVSFDLWRKHFELHFAARSVLELEPLLSDPAPGGDGEGE